MTKTNPFFHLSKHIYFLLQYREPRKNIHTQERKQLPFTVTQNFSLILTRPICSTESLQRALTSVQLVKDIIHLDANKSRKEQNARAFHTLYACLFWFHLYVDAYVQEFHQLILFLEGAALLSFTHCHFNYFIIQTHCSEFFHLFFPYILFLYDRTKIKVKKSN